MRVKIMMQRKGTGEVTEIANFRARGDALWAATLFASHKIFSRDYNYWIQEGKKSYVPCTAINPENFNLYIPNEGK